MKTKSTLLAVAFCGMLSSAFAFDPGVNIQPKEKEIVSNPAPVRAHRQADGIMVSWSSANAAGIMGYEVERTYFDPADPYATWEQVSFVAEAGQRTYKSFDAGVFAGNISYRVVAVSQDGSRSNSETVTVKFSRHEK